MGEAHVPEGLGDPAVSRGGPALCPKVARLSGDMLRQFTHGRMRTDRRQSNQHGRQQRWRIEANGRFPGALKTDSGPFPIRLPASDLTQ